MGLRFNFVCSNGCGVCSVKLAVFEFFRSETPSGELIDSQVVPIVVSTCCESEVDVWDEKTNDTIASIAAIKPKGTP